MYNPNDMSTEDTDTKFQIKWLVEVILLENSITGTLEFGLQIWGGTFISDITVYQAPDVNDIVHYWVTRYDLVLVPLWEEWMELIWHWFKQLINDILHIPLQGRWANEWKEDWVN